MDAVGVINQLPLVINERAAITSINVFPNPSSENIFVQLKSEAVKEMNLFSINGLLLLKTNEAKISLVNLESGFYILQVIGESGATNTMRVIKQ